MQILAEIMRRSWSAELPRHASLRGAMAIFCLEVQLAGSYVGMKYGAEFGPPFI